MKLTDKITKTLIGWCNSGNDIVVPNWYIRGRECDVLRITKAGVSYEYEIKVSRSDFFADFKKQHVHWNGEVSGNKHTKMKAGDRCNKFFFVVPFELIKIDECPDYAGLIYFHENPFDKGQYSKLWVVKPAPMIHKEKLQFNDLSSKLWFREQSMRNRLAYHKRDMKDMRDLKAEVSRLQIKNGELSSKIWELENPEEANSDRYLMRKSLQLISHNP